MQVPRENFSCPPYVQIPATNPQPAAKPQRQTNVGLKGAFVLSSREAEPPNCELLWRSIAPDHELTPLESPPSSAPIFSKQRLNPSPASQDSPIPAPFEGRPFKKDAACNCPAAITLARDIFFCKREPESPKPPRPLLPQQPGPTSLTPPILTSETSFLFLEKVASWLQFFWTLSGEEKKKQMEWYRADSQAYSSVLFNHLKNGIEFLYRCQTPLPERQPPISQTFELIFRNLFLLVEDVNAIVLDPEGKMLHLLPLAYHSDQLFGTNCTYAFFQAGGNWLLAVERLPIEEEDPLIDILERMRNPSSNLHVYYGPLVQHLLIQEKSADLGPIKASFPLRLLSEIVKNGNWLKRVQDGPESRLRREFISLLPFYKKSPAIFIEALGFPTLYYLDILLLQTAISGAYREYHQNRVQP
ncbi:MAG: hypothetical protein K0S07_1240 [Chlamydiales bacterium]|jgi:hypothetical protein|nr:hypothetical protein [Chlamydiales bacterium]